MAKDLPLPEFRLKSRDELINEFRETQRGLDLPGFESMNKPFGQPPPLLEGLTETLKYGVTSLFGGEPSNTVRRFQQAHPALALGAEIAPSLGFFALPVLAPARLGLGAARAIPGLSRAVRFAETASKTAPVRAAFSREVARFAPIELARLGITAATTQDYEKTKSVAESAAINLAFAGVVGSTFEKIRLSNRFPRDRVEGGALIQQRLPNYDLNASAQEKLQFVERSLARYDESQLGYVQEALIKERDKLRVDVLLETPNKGRGYVKEIAGKRGARQALSRRFTPGTNNAVQTQTLTIGEKSFGFESKSALDDVLRRLGLPEGFEQHVQFPRLLTARTERGSAELRKTLTSNLRRLTDDIRIAQETDDGLYVVAKRITGRARKPQIGDEFLLFKTDNPGLFHPAGERFAKRLASLYKQPIARGLQHPLESQVFAARHLNELEKLVPSDVPLTGAVASDSATALLDESRLVGPKPGSVREDTTNLGRFLKAEFKKYFAPRLTAFGGPDGSQRAVGLAAKLRSVFNAATARAAQLYYGKNLPSNKKGLVGQIFNPGKRIDSIDLKAKALTAEDLVEVTTVHQEALTLDQMRQRGFSSRTREYFEQLLKVDELQSGETQAAERIVKDVLGDERVLFRPLPQHYMISRTWRGPFRLELFVEENGLKRRLDYASGYHRNEVYQEAEAIAKAVAEDAPSIKVQYSKDPNALVKRDFHQDLLEAASIPIEHPATQAVRAARARLFREAQAPARFQPRGKSGLGSLTFLRPFTKEELQSTVFGNIYESQLYQAELMYDYKLGTELAKLSQEHPDLYKLLIKTKKDYRGEVGPIAKWFDTAMDTVLAPFFGSQTASRTARALNRAQFALTLGAMDMGFVGINAATPIQTVLPELAFIIGSPPRLLKQWYSPALVMTKNGMRSMNVLTPEKMLRTSFQKAMRPSAEMAEHIDWGLRNNVIDKPFIESFQGAASEAVRDLRPLLNQEETWPEFLLRLSEFLPAKSEEFSRGISFISGLEVGEKVFGHQGTKLRLFAKEFTDRTSYLYTRGDRAQIITGAAGKTIGLFKNWPMHYIANMAGPYFQASKEGYFGPMLWTMAGSGALGGIAAMPFIYPLAEGMSQLLADQPLMNTVYTMFGQDEIDNPVGDFAAQRLTDMAYFGIPGLLGVSLQGRAAPPGTEIMRDINMLWSIAILDRARTLGKAIGATFDAVDVRTNPIRSQQVRDLYIRALAPRTLYRAMSLTADGGLRSLATGNRLISEVTFPEGLAYSLGFNPVKLEQFYSISTNAWREQGELRDQITRYGRMLAQLQEEGAWADFDAMTVRASMEVPIDSVLKSKDAFVDKGREDLIDRQFDALVVERLSRGLRR